MPSPPMLRIAACCWSPVVVIGTRSTGDAALSQSRGDPLGLPSGQRARAGSEPKRPVGLVFHALGSPLLRPASPPFPLCLQSPQLLRRNDHAATDDKLACLVKGDVQIDALALSHGDRATGHRDGRIGNQDGQHRFVRGVVNRRQAFAGHEAHRPDAFAGILDGDDPRELDVALAEKEIADLFDGRIHGPHAGQPQHQTLEEVGENAANARRHELPQEIQEQHKDGQEERDGVLRPEIGQVHVTAIESLAACWAAARPIAAARTRRPTPE